MKMNSVMHQLHRNTLARANARLVKLFDCTLFASLGEDDAEASSPYYHTLVVGYERFVLEYLEDTTHKLQQGLIDLTYEDLHDRQPDPVRDCFFAIAFPEAGLEDLPRPYVDLNRSIENANPHSYSRMMMLFEAGTPAVEDSLTLSTCPSLRKFLTSARQVGMTLRW